MPIFPDLPMSNSSVTTLTFLYIEETYPSSE
jgi:hypothetical protein